MDAQARKKALFRAKLKEQAQKTRIDSPLVRYNEVDQPVCRVCDVALKSESLWPAHQASKKHREANTNLKANASRQNPSNNTKPAPVKELAKSKPDGSVAFHDAGRDSSSEMQKPKKSSALPANFFDNPESEKQKSGSGDPKFKGPGSSVKAETLASNVDVSKPSGIMKSHDPIREKPSAETGSESTQAKGALPEGFFDNKEADLRARGIEPVKPDVKDEYKEFEKLIQEDLNVIDNRFEEDEIDAAEMIEEEETVEQMTYKERIEILKRKRKEMFDSRSSKAQGEDSNAPSKKSLPEQVEAPSEDDDDDDDDVNFAVDWRAQHI